MIKFCSLYSGSSGNSAFIKAGDTCLLVDAGVSAKKINEALDSIDESPCGLSAILVTHEHIDHVRGIGVLSRKFGMPVYATEGTWRGMESLIGEIDPANKRILTEALEFEIGSITIKPFAIPHDAFQPVGYNIFAESRKVTVATDIGHIDKQLLANFEMSDLILLESNHDVEMLKVGPYPWPLKRRILGDTGHLSNEIAAKVVSYLAGKGTKRFLLGHLSKENNFPQLAYQTVANELCEYEIGEEGSIMLDIAQRDRVGRIFEL